ncbi:MAG: hypothetical protein JWN15_1800 [Firmicutes bacterium]|nr:hypothetical protein [Bacillota bacterium]
MGQVGLHALTGLVVGDRLSAHVQSRVGRRALMFGFLLGNILPDLDFLAVVGLYPVNRGLALNLHRSFTHSLLAAVALGLGCYVAGLLMRDNYVRYLGYGLALGTVAHFVEDIFLWFTPVDIFWPASVYGLIPPVDIWGWFHTPILVGRLLGAGELAAFALYYGHLARLALAYETDAEAVPLVRRMAAVCWVAWALLTALCFDLAGTRFDLYFYVPMGLVFMPACLYLTWRMQSTIEFIGVFGQPHQNK